MNKEQNNKKEENFMKENLVIFKKYKIKKKLAEGAFGDIYKGVCIETNELVAIKVEPKNKVKPLLETEAFFLYSLKGLGIPEVLSFGRVKNHNVLVEPLLDKSLFDIFNENRKRMSLEDICLIANQILERIQWVHSKNIVHRDIKPDNFLIGRKDPNIIYLIDFGLSKKYKSSTTGKHIRFGFTGKLTGTVRFASANALRGGEQSRKDDLESIGYMLIFFMRGKLPWQGVMGNKKIERYLKIYKMKKNVAPEDLCKSLPNQMTEYMKYVKSLEFQQDPDYKYLRNLFSSILKKIHDTNDFLLFSWIKLSDIPNLKNPINPSTRRDSPQNRLYRKIETKLKSERNLSSDNDSNQKSYRTSAVTINNKNSNGKNDNEDTDELEIEFKSKKDKYREGLNTMATNFNNTLDENIVDFVDDDQNKFHNDYESVNIKNNLKSRIFYDKEKNNTVNEILNFQSNGRCRQNQTSFCSLHNLINKNEDNIIKKKKEIKDEKKGNNIDLIEIKEKKEENISENNNKTNIENNIILNNDLKEPKKANTNEKEIEFKNNLINSINNIDNNLTNENENKNNLNNIDEKNLKEINEKDINNKILNNNNLDENYINKKISKKRMVQKKKIIINNTMQKKEIEINKKNVSQKGTKIIENKNNNLKINYEVPVDNKIKEKIFKKIQMDRKTNSSMNNSAKNYNHFNNNIKRINEDMILLNNTENKNNINEKNNNIYNEKLNSYYNQNKNLYLNLDFFSHNSDEIKSKKSKDIFNKTEIKNINLKNIKNNLNLDTKNFSEKKKKKKLISNSVNMFQNNTNFNQENLDIININVFIQKNQREINKTIKKENNSTLINNLYKSNINNINKINLNNIEFNNNRNIRIVNRNRNPKRNNANLFDKNNKGINNNINEFVNNNFSLINSKEKIILNSV